MSSIYDTPKYERPLFIGLLTSAIVLGLYWGGKASKERCAWACQPPVYISGKVVGESLIFDPGIIGFGECHYTFSVETEQGLKRVEYHNISDDCKTLDSLISPDVDVKVRLGPRQSIEETTFSISANQLKEVNGHPTNL